MEKDKNKLLKSDIKEISEDIYYLNDDNIVVCKICTKPLGIERSSSQEIST